MLLLNYNFLCSDRNMDCVALSQTVQAFAHICQKFPTDCGQNFLKLNANVSDVYDCLPEWNRALVLQSKWFKPQKIDIMFHEPDGFKVAHKHSDMYIKN